MSLRNGLFVLLIFTLVIGCTQQAPPSVPTPPSTPAPAPTPTVAPQPTPAPTPTPQPTPTPSQEVREIDVTARQWAFDPNPIEVKKGQLVRLRITSVDVTHGFTIPEFGINERLEPGQTVTVEFTPDQTGTFPFFCSVFCGAGHPNMRGEIVVTE